MAQEDKKYVAEQVDTSAADTWDWESFGDQHYQEKADERLQWERVYKRRMQKK